MREKYNMPNLHTKSDLVYNLWLYVLAIQDSGCLKVGPQWLWYMDKDVLAGFFLPIDSLSNIYSNLLTWLKKLFIANLNVMKVVISEKKKNWFFR